MPPARRLAAFIDRDGVINAEHDHGDRIGDFHVPPGRVDALRLLAAHGFAVAVVSNQAGIAKGKYDEVYGDRLTKHMRSLFAARGIAFADSAHCPHHARGTVAAYGGDCDCRKPAPGMLLRAARELALGLSRSVLVDDKTSGAQAGRAAGLRFTVLVESGHRLPADALQYADRRCADVAAAAKWLCEPERLST